MGYEVFESWMNIYSPAISNNGTLLSWEAKPDQGDGWLYYSDFVRNSNDSVRHACCAAFSANSEFIVYRLKTPYDSLRKLKIAKTDEKELPGDTIVIKVFGRDSVFKAGPVKSIKLAAEISTWVAFSLNPDKMKEPDVPADTTQPGKKAKKTVKKKGAFPLILYNPINGHRLDLQNVTSFTLSKTGNIFGYIEAYGDSIDSCKVSIFRTESEKLETIFSGQGKIASLTIDDPGQQIAFSYSPDTSERKLFRLFYWKEGAEARMIVDTMMKEFPENWSVSNDDMYFTENKKWLVFQTAPKPDFPVADTVPEDEKPKFDLWKWDDNRLMSQQLAELKDDEQKSFVAVFHTETGKVVQIGDTAVPDISISMKTDIPIVMGVSEASYQKLLSWDSPEYRDVYVFDILTGRKTRLLTKHQYNAELSPGGKYLVFWQKSDSCWYSINTQNLETSNLTKSLKTPLYDTEYDIPNDPPPYGIAGWMEQDAYVLIKDEFDIWKLDLTGKTPPACLTKNFGRKTNVEYRIIKTDPDQKYFPMKGKLLLATFNKTTRAEGFAEMTCDSKKNPAFILQGDFHLSTPRKAKNADIFFWQRSTFNEYPDIWFAKEGFSMPQKISIANPQQSSYKWGTAELVSWQTPTGKTLEGLLYKPEGFKAEQKYPMIVYFYEKNSDNLHRYYTPKATPSIIQPPFYTSNGYVIFIPDIEYEAEKPGASAYDAVISGTNFLISKGFIDSSRIGIQGQSWGGYQVAWLITQTDMFKAAMAGAPVSNMTSAYGGIRWEEGVSRMFQYEDGQSRLGKTLWENRDIYINNSPLFFADKISTPLLIMHNDGDGAVPYYQTIELFLAMRRLNKPAWWLNYNGEEHNLTKYPNRKDLSIRMFQFFEYLLKDAPEPKWMKTGIPAIKKGKSLEY
ncbi:MAG: prolyl oligopeptidase family serine peptidase [Bacteroidetes bacterium]|nr:prolyl oligopeptidase family serine peptidase [Bacteroidota bacterium]MBU1720949.1 prolyl oligopeptidase family serine peptidase [Bacteroidota bacterium]